MKNKNLKKLKRAIKRALIENNLEPSGYNTSVFCQSKLYSDKMGEKTSLRQEAKNTHIVLTELFGLYNYHGDEDKLSERAKFINKNIYKDLKEALNLKPETLKTIDEAIANFNNSKPIDLNNAGT